MKFCEYMKTDWFQGLQREVENSTKAEVARRMGVKRSRLSCVMNGLGAYGTGAASTAKLEEQYRRAFEQVSCPFNGNQVGIEYCRESALCSVPTQNPRMMMQWQACQKCEFKPKPLETPTQKRKKRSIEKDGESVQQAGIIDTVTLPLPIIGGPQIQPQQEPA